MENIRLRLQQEKQKEKEENYRSELAKKLIKIRSKDILTEEDKNLNLRSEDFRKKKKWGRGLAINILEDEKNTDLYKKTNLHTKEKKENSENNQIEEIINTNFTTFIDDRGERALYDAKKYLEFIRSYAYKNNFIFMIDDQFRKDVIDYVNSGSFLKLKEQKIKLQFLLLNKFFELKDFINKNYKTKVGSSLEAKPSAKNSNIRHASLDNYDNKRRVFKKK